MENELLAQVTGTGAVRRLQVQLHIAAPIQSAWSAITDSDGLDRWWIGGTVEKRVGGRIILDDGTAVNGTVTACAEPYVFEFTWNDHPSRATHPALIHAATRSLLRFDLIEEGDGTLLSFVQYLPPAEIAAAAAGWHQLIIERLKSYLESGEVPEHEARFADLKLQYEKAGIS